MPPRSTASAMRRRPTGSSAQCWRSAAFDIAQPEGTVHLMASLLYGAGLRLLECCRLRVKDVDLERGEIVMRDGKGARDRVTMLPVRLVPALAAQLERVRAQQTRDLADGTGSVELPLALERKYPRAPYEIGWQPGDAERSNLFSTNATI